MRVSGVIICRNEEENIARAIESLDWCDEVVVVDSGSDDRTVEIAAALGARTIVREWPGFAEQKQFAADAASNDWVFSLDADEMISPELRGELVLLKEGSPAAHGFFVPRLSVYMGRSIRHGGWYPDHQLRLFDRTKGKWNGRLIHESVEMAPGSVVGSLKGDIIHFSVRDAGHHHRMIGERYAPLAAGHMFSVGRRTSPMRIAIAGPAAFIRSYFLKLGFLDGLPGFSIAAFAAHHSFLKHLHLWELQSGEKSPEST